MVIFTFSVESMIRGYHEYIRIWESPSPTDNLFCQREIGNPHNTHAVAVKGNVTGDDGTTTIVGHVPRKLSAIFIRCGGTINCVVNSTRRYSADLPQGGLEIPCVLNFTAKTQSEAAKTERLLISALNVASTGISKEAQIISSSVPCSDVKDHFTMAVVNDAIPKPEPTPTVDLTEYCKRNSPPAKKQKTFDTEKITMGDELSDGEINYTQRLLKMKHPEVGGLRLTLYKGKSQEIESNVQIVHCPTRHRWITTTTLNCKGGEVKIFHSLFTFCNKETVGIIYDFYQRGTEKLTITMSRCQKQTGGKDCELFAIAFALVFNLNASNLKFRQQMMRSHLVDCFTKEVITPFPCK